MRNNIEHIKAILNVFLDSETAYVDFIDVKEKYPSEDDEDFIHHYIQLIECGYITNSEYSSLPSQLGIVTSLDGYVSYFNANLRLTAAGHEFADTLNAPTFIERIADFKDQPLDVIKDVGKELVSSYLKKKLGID